MNIKEIEVLYNKIKEIEPNISTPLRLGYPLDQNKIDDLLSCMDKLIEITKNDDTHSKKLLSILWSLHEDMEAEVRHKGLHYPDLNFMYLAAYSSKLSDLIGYYVYDPDNENA